MTSNQRHFILYMIPPYWMIQKGGEGGQGNDDEDKEENVNLAFSCSGTIICDVVKWRT